MEILLLGSYHNKHTMICMYRFSPSTVTVVSHVLVQGKKEKEDYS